MNKLFIVMLIAAFGALGVTNYTFASETKEAVGDNSNCGAGLDDNWNVKNGGDIKSHLKHHLKIDKTADGKYSVKIKNEGGDIVFSSKNDFILSCNGSRAELTGEVMFGNCKHRLEIGYAGEDEISIRIPTVHAKGDCTGHKDTLHEKDRKNHNTVASGKRRGSGKN